MFSEKGSHWRESFSPELSVGSAAGKMQSIDQIEHKLRALQLPEHVIQNHLKQVRRLRALPRRRMIKIKMPNAPGRRPRWHWQLMEEN